MKNLFNSVQLTKPKGNVFDLTHDVKMSGKMGYLMPTLVLEAVPGDKFNIGCDQLVRFAPLIAPIMHRINVTMHYFFVPNRLVWPNWEDYVTAVETGGLPVIEIDETLSDDQKKFLDYMSVPPPPVGATSTQISAIPFAAYQMIYNEYYRDENLVPEVNFQLSDGLNAVGDLLDIRKRAYEHDYFTSSLPFAQKGNAVSIPLGDVQLDPDWFTSGNNPVFLGNLVTPTGNVTQNAGTIDVGGVSPAAFDPNGSLQVGATTINELRRAYRLQEWLERNARGGTRYIEQILAHFGVKSKDSRLQRPEYITGVKSPVVISEVLNTTGESAGLPQGNMAGHAVSVQNGNTGEYYCTEHGYIIGIASVIPLTAYQQGIPKTFLKRDYLDLFWPSFGHIGEQEVQVQELYAYTANKEGTFGYVPRYAEYKFMPSRVAGDFRNTLSYWHLGRIFATEPALTQEFIEVDPDDNSRIFAVVDSTDNLYMHFLHKIRAYRLMPKFGTPLS